MPQSLTVETKRSRTLLRSLILPIWLALAACSSTSQRPIEYYAVVPDSGWPTVVGEVRGAALLTNTVYVEAIDGKPVRDPFQSGKVPVALAPGRHLVHISQNLGQFNATVPFVLDAKAGGVYRAHAQQDLETTTWYGRPMFGDVGGPSFFWIEDATSGELVTPQIRVNVRVQGGGGVVPIFIPRGR